MTIRTTPPISLSDVMAELRVTNPGRAYPISLGDADVRALAGVPSGPISLSDLYGKSAFIPLSVTAKNDRGDADTRFGAATVTCSPGVLVSGGTGAKSYSWSVLSSGRNVVVSLSNSPTVSAEYSFRQNETGSATVLLRCTVTDAAGAQQTVDVTGWLEWYGSL